MQLQPIRGTKDLLPDEYEIFQEVVNKARAVLACYSYRELATPIIEYSEVFKRTLGEYSDVVNKEMYSFIDRGGHELTLRPEHTAGIARCVLSNGLQHLLPLKLFGVGPNFRYERPQKGRQRQFHHISVEAIGYKDPAIDAETIALAAHILREWKILDKTRLEINSLGDAISRRNYHATLVRYLEQHKDSLSEDSRVRLEKNPLRVLDSKDKNDKKIVASAPMIYDSLTDEAKQFFDQVCAYLTKLNINYKINPQIVRGLDYYSHTTFEFITEELGAQGTILGGGRYDDLYQVMGNAQIPAIGFAIGIERAVELYKSANPKIALPRGITLVALDKQYADFVLTISQEMRYAGKLVHLEQNNNPGKAIKKAVANNSKLIILFGKDEIESRKVKIKNLDTSEEVVVELSNILNYVKNHEF